MSYYTIVKDDYKLVDGNRCYRIRATQDFKNSHKNVKKGELGGYVNWDLKDYSWVFGNAIAYNCNLRENSYIVGDHTYRGIALQNSSIQGTGDYINESSMNDLRNTDIIGHNFIKGSWHSVVWGIDKTTKEIKVSVGCQFYSVEDWKKYYINIADRQGYSRKVSEYLAYLNRIEFSMVSSNEKILDKISEKILSLKNTVTETLKTETISLVTSLKPTEKVVSKSGPQRDKFGRFAKKAT